jgi:hypothetical protein
MLAMRRGAGRTDCRIDDALRMVAGSVDSGFM